MHRHELSDTQYAHLEPSLPEPRHHGKAGRPWLPHRTVVDGILRVLRTGAPWRDLPERYGKWNTVFARFNRWRRDGTWARILSALLDKREADARYLRRLRSVSAATEMAGSMTEGES